MKHPYITDKKYKWGALFLIAFIIAGYLASNGDYLYANIAMGVFLSVAIVGYFKMRR